MIPKPSEPFWKGPYKDGLTQSLMLKFDECPFRAYLHLICGLKDTGPPHENLIWGDTLHKGLEYLLKGFSLTESIFEMREYLYERYPGASATYAHTTAQMLKLYPLEKTLSLVGPVNTEIVFEKYISILGKTVLLKGKVDFLSKDNSYLGDHKCKGKIYPLETLTELGTDFQMNLYAYIFEVSNWIYDLIAIPEQAYRVPEYYPHQSAMDYANKIFNTHYDTAYGFPITNHRDRWICQIPFYQPMEKIDTYFNKTIAPFINRIIEWWEYVTDPNFDPNNPNCYNSTFYQKPVRMFDPAKTDKYKCNYYKLLTEQEDYSDLTKIQTMFPELSNEQ